MSDKKSRILPWKQLHKEKHVKASEYVKREIKLKKPQKQIPSSKHVILHTPSQTLDFCLNPLNPNSNLYFPPPRGP